MKQFFYLLLLAAQTVGAIPAPTITPGERVFILKAPDGTLYIKRVPAPLAPKRSPR